MAQKVTPDLTSHAVAAATLADLGLLRRQLLRRDARQRNDSPWTYRELAAKTGWSLGSIARYLDGKVVPPTDRFDALVQMLGATDAEQGALATARDRIAETRRSSPADVQAPARRIPRQLPARAAGFTGRAAELSELDALRDAGGPSALVISAVQGTAGVGKTALAVYWAHRVASEYPDGQLYVNLRGFDPGGLLMDPGEALRRFLDALGVPAEHVPAGLDAQAALYRSELAGRRMLVILDNARDTAQVRPLLPGAAGCLTLVTSRNQLPGLVASDGAHSITLDLLSTDEARDMLARRLGQQRLAAEPDTVCDIITRCARLPLALAIMAARANLAKDLPLAALCDELRVGRGRLDALSTGDDPHTDVRTVFSCSYRALTEDAAGLFRLLGLHPGPDISAAAAASLVAFPLAAVRRLLSELIRLNLIVEHTPGRYAFHDLLRVYANDLTCIQDSEGQRRDATRRLLDHYLHTAHATDQLLYRARDPITLGPLQPGVIPEHPADHDQALSWFTAERAVLLAAVDHAVATGFDAHAWQLAWTLSTFLDRHGYWHDWHDSQQAAAIAARKLADPLVQARTHRYLAHAHIRLRRLEDARTQLQLALDLYGQAGDPVGQAHTYRNLGIVWERQGRYAEALDNAQRALDLYRAAGHRGGQANALNNIGWFHTLLGDHEQALIHCRQALTLHQEHGDRGGQAETWDSIGHAHHHLGQYTQAISCYQRALEFNRDLTDHYGEAFILTHLGDAYQAAGNLDLALQTWQLALTILDHLGHPDANGVRSKLTVAARSAGDGVAEELL